MKNYSEITYRYLKKEKKRSILTIIAIVLAISLVCAIGTCLVSFRQSSINQAKKIEGDYHLKIENIKSDKIKNIKSHVDIEKVGISQKQGLAKVLSDTKSNRYINIIGVTKDTLSIIPSDLKVGRLPEKPNEIAIDESATDYIKNLKLNKNIKLNLNGKVKEFKVTGLIKNFVYSPENKSATAIIVMDKYNKSMNSEIFIKVKPKKNVKNLIDELNKNFKLKDDGSIIKPNSRLLYLEGRGIKEVRNEAITGEVQIAIGIVVISTILVIYNIFQISIIERIKQFGILRSIGATPRQIRKIVLKEATVLSIISIPIGLIMGVLSMKIVFSISYLLLLRTPIIKDFDYFTIVISKEVLIISGLIGLASVYISAFIPAYSAGKISPLDAIRSNTNIKKEKIKRRKNIIFRKLFGIEGDIAYKNIKRNKKRFFITVSSMVISIVLFICFNSIMNFENSLDIDSKIKSGDFIVTKFKRPELGINTALSDKEYKYIKSIKGVDKVYKILQDYSYNIEASKNELSKDAYDIFNDKKNSYGSLKNGKFNIVVNLRGYNDELLQQCKLKNINEDVLNKEHGVIIINNGRLYSRSKQQMCNIEVWNFKVGDKIVLLNNKNNKKVVVKVLGIINSVPIENSFSQGNTLSMLIGEKFYKDITNKKYFENIHVMIKKDSNRNYIKESLKTLTKKDSKITIIDREEDERTKQSIKLVICIFVYGFVAIIGLIGILNIINTISTNLILRKTELAALTSIGMSFNQIRKMVYLEGVLYGIISSIYGSVIGSVLSYFMFTKMVRIEMFKWQLPLDSIIIASLVSTLVALASTYIPLKKLTKKSIIENMKVE